MCAVQFVPAASVTHTEASGRELKFKQYPDGSVIVKVQNGSDNKINRVVQNNIILIRGAFNSTPLNEMTNAERKIVLETICRNIGVKITTENGKISNVKNHTYGGYYSTVTNIEISY